MTRETAEETRARDWELWLDWCMAATVDPVRAEPAELEQFLSFVSGRPSTRQRRVKNIIRMMRRRGGGEAFFDSDDEPVEGRASVGVSLAQIPVHRYPVGLRGRRDAWLVATADAMRFTRLEVCALMAADVGVYPVLTVKGRKVPRADDPKQCPACAVARWLSVLGFAHLGWRDSLRQMLLPGEAADGHDCARPIVGEWRSAPTLTPAIDQHGWLSGEPLSVTSVSIILGVRRRLVAAVVEEIRRKVWTGGPIDSQSLADDFDEVDRHVQALLDRTESLLDDADEMNDRITELR